MNFKESIRSSIKSLFHNKLRSLLTMLGVIIGIFSVITLTSIGEGLKQEVGSQVESLGANLLYVVPGKIQMGPPKKGESQLSVQDGHFNDSPNVLTYDDVLLLKGQDNIATATGSLTSIDRLDDLNIFVSTTGVDEDFNKINKLDFAHGRFINGDERKNKAKVAVIGQQANIELFNNQNSIGKSFKINGQDYRVIGILKYKEPENLGPQAENINTKIYLPITDVLDRKADKTVGQILVQAPSSQDVEAAATVIKNTLSQNHPEGNFTVLKQKDILKAINNILGALTAGLGGIAAISLLVGGIGIMNIMLVSVTERTKEIGIRKAIGAKRRDILVQFLIEAVFLSLIGGLLGLLAGITGARLLPQILPNINTAVSMPAVITALVFALLVGIFFGVYPALKAAKLDPIEALRSE